MSKWLHIDNEIPFDGEDVFYYFAYFDEVYEGKYFEGKPQDVGGNMITFSDNIFCSPKGFLGDDVTYWMPRSPNDPEPEPPSDEEKKNDKYHPRG